MNKSAQNCDIKILPDAAALGETAARFIAETAAQVLRAKEKFSIVLAGGKTPRAVYELLASARFENEIKWRRTRVFFGDERCVPPFDEQSNFRMANEALLSKIEIPAENVFRLRGEIAPSDAAAEYERLIKETLGEPPPFDLILLGLGDDAHTASLFPATAALKETEKLVAANYVEKLNAFRLTLTFPAINSAARVIFLVTGAGKASAVKNVFSEKSYDFPASLVEPRGECVWFLDEAAASLL
jgi:6-phosphogluconolactonase